MKKLQFFWAHFSSLSELGGNYILALYSSVVIGALVAFLVWFYSRMTGTLSPSFYLLLAVFALVLTAQTFLLERFHALQLDQFERQEGLARQIDYLERVGRQNLSTLLTSTRQSREASRRSASLSRDALTEALRKETGVKEISKAILSSHDGKRLSIAVLDIDHFKKLNDRYGHAMGDLALSQFSKTIRKHLRGDDIFCRWGGEEFLIAVKGLDPTGFQQLLQRLLTAVSEIRIETPTEPIALTVSAGAAFLDELPAAARLRSSLRPISEPPTTADPMMGTARALLEECFQLADQRLFQAKRNGRNQVRLV